MPAVAAVIHEIHFLNLPILLDGFQMENRRGAIENGAPKVRKSR